MWEPVDQTKKNQMTNRAKRGRNNNQRWLYAIAEMGDAQIFAYKR
jgi:hypothetical protein